MSLRSIAMPVLLAVASSFSAARNGLAADTFTADPVHSGVVFRVKHMNTSHFWGRFNDIAGKFSIDESDPSQSTFAFTIKTASIDTNNAQRDQHLKSPDFFNAVQFPTLSFKSTAVTRASDGTYEVVGDLTLHGVTKPVRVKVVPTGNGKDMKGAPTAGIDASFIVKQSEFGMSKMVGPLGDDVWVNVSVEGVKK
jgi:polyisoprenoid-binding protein YceI